MTNKSKGKEETDWKETIRTKWYLWNKIDDNFVTCGEEIIDFIETLLADQEQLDLEEMKGLIPEEKRLCPSCFNEDNPNNWCKEYEDALSWNACRNELISKLRAREEIKR